GKEHELVEAAPDVGAAVVPVHAVKVRSARLNGRVVRQRSTTDAFEVLADVLQHCRVELAARDVDIARRDVASHLLQMTFVGADPAVVLDPLQLSTCDPSLVQVSHSMSSVPTIRKLFVPRDDPVGSHESGAFRKSPRLKYFSSQTYSTMNMYRAPISLIFSFA